MADIKAFYDQPTGTVSYIVSDPDTLISRYRSTRRLHKVQKAEELERASFFSALNQIQHFTGEGRDLLCMFAVTEDGKVIAAFDGAYAHVAR